MVKKIAFGSLGLFLLASPVLASADALSDLQAQIQSLLAQIATLKAQIGANPTGGTTAPVACVALSNSLSLDDEDANTNGDVTKLQKFLASQGGSIYPEARVTGYFGPATLRAVQRWQAARGLVSSGDPDSTGYGYVGPKTRGAMACGGVQTTPGTNTHVPPVTTYVPPPNTTIASEATCIFVPNSTGRTDNIGFGAQQVRTADICKNNCLTSRNEKYGVNESGICTYTGPNGVGQSIMSIPPISTPATPSITFNSISSGNVIGSFTNLPANSQIRFVNASTGQRYDAQSTMVWSGGSGPLSITIPNDLPGGTYYLRATDYYNPNTTIAQSSSFQAGTNVQTNPVVINSFTASPATVNAGQAVMFMWSSNLNSTDTSYYGGGCSIEGLTQNNVALQVTPGFVSGGTVTYVPPATATYTLRCSSGAKDGSPSATRQITVNVGQPQTNPVVISSFNASQTSVSSGQPVTFTWNSNLSSNDISYYGGFCSISALTSYNQQVHIANGAGASGSVSYTPALTATYTLMCSAGGKDGSPTDTKQVTVSVQ